MKIKNLWNHHLELLHPSPNKPPNKPKISKSATFPTFPNQKKTEGVFPTIFWVENPWFNPDFCWGKTLKPSNVPVTSHLVAQLEGDEWSCKSHHWDTWNIDHLASQGWIEVRWGVRFRADWGVRFRAQWEESWLLKIFLKQQNKPGNQGLYRWKVHHFMIPRMGQNSAPCWPNALKTTLEGQLQPRVIKQLLRKNAHDFH